MNNAEKFQEVFGYYATEMWAKPETEFLEWINSEYRLREQSVEVGKDCISRAYAIEVLSHIKEDEQWRTECIDNEIRLIKLLPSVVPQVPSEDCISREDAVKALMSYFIPQTYTGEEVEQASKLARKIMAIVPSVTPKANNDEWVEEFSDDGWRWVKDEL